MMKMWVANAGSWRHFAILDCNGGGRNRRHVASIHDMLFDGDNLWQRGTIVDLWMNMLYS